MKIAIASANQGKIKEIQAVLDIPGVEWLTMYERSDWPAVDETGADFSENAHLKAAAISVYLDLPALADDSGLEVDALGGLPGVRSARFAGPDAADADNVSKLIADLSAIVTDGGSSVDAGKRGFAARFVSVVVLAWPDGRMLEARGVCEGKVLLSARGEGGFGYDPIFAPAGFNRTMAELGPAEKNEISHRGRALRELRKELEGGPGLDA